MSGLQAWCPACAEMVLPTDAGLCVWCDEPVRRRAPAKRGKPFGVYGKLTDDQVRAVHRVYLEQRLSLRACGAPIYRAAGYASPHAAANSLFDHFRRLGLPTRTRAEANTRHGKMRRGARNREHVRALRVARGEVLERPRCAAVKAQAPRKGTPCQNRAQAGSDYCWAHDPARAAEREDLLAGMRSRIGRAA